MGRSNGGDVTSVVLVHVSPSDPSGGRVLSFQTDMTPGATLNMEVRLVSLRREHQLTLEMPPFLELQEGQISQIVRPSPEPMFRLWRFLAKGTGKGSIRIRFGTQTAAWPLTVQETSTETDQ